MTVQHDMANFMSSWNCAASKAPKVMTALTTLLRRADQVSADFECTKDFSTSCRQFVSSWNRAAKNAPMIEKIYQTFILTTKKPVLAPTLVEFLAAWEAAAARLFALKKVLDSKVVVSGEQIKKYTLEFKDAWDTSASLLSSLQTSMYQLSGFSPLAGAQTTGSAPQFLIEMDSIDAKIQRTWANAMAEMDAAMNANMVMNLDSLMAHPVHYIPDVASKFNKGIKAASAAFMAPWNNAATKAQLIESLLRKPGTKDQFMLQVPQDRKVYIRVQSAINAFISTWQEAQNPLSILEKEMLLSPDADSSSEKTEILVSSWQASVQWLRDLRVKVTICMRPNVASTKKTEALEDIEKIMSSFIDSWKKAKGSVNDIQPFIYKVAEVKPSGSSVPNSDMPIFMPSMEGATDEFTKAWGIASSDFPDMDKVLSTIKFPDIEEPEMIDFATQEAVAKFMGSWNSALAKANTVQSGLIRLENNGRVSVKIPDQVDLSTSIQEAIDDFTDAWKRAKVSIVIFQQLFPNFSKNTATSLMHHWDDAAQSLSVIQRSLTISNSPEYGTSERRKASRQVAKAIYAFIESWTSATEKAREIHPQVYKLVGMKPSAVPVGIAPVFMPSKDSSSEFQAIWKFMVAEFDGFDKMMDEISIPKVSVATAPPKIFSLIDEDLSVQKAVTGLMASWNIASQSLDQIRKSCLISEKEKSFAIPSDKTERNTLLGAINTLMAAYDTAIRKVYQFETVILDLSEEEDGVKELKRNLAEYLYSWNTAAKRIQIVREYLTINPFLCKRCLDMKVIPEFFAACHEASLRVPKIETAFYALSGATSLDTCAACLTATSVSVTPNTKVAKKKYVAEFNKSMAQIPKTKVTTVLPVPSKFSRHVQSYSFSIRSFSSSTQTSNRLFAPVRDLPIYVEGSV